MITTETLVLAGVAVWWLVILLLLSSVGFGIGDSRVLEIVLNVVPMMGVYASTISKIGTHQQQSAAALVLAVLVIMVRDVYPWNLWEDRSCKLVFMFGAFVLLSVCYMYAHSPQKLAGQHRRNGGRREVVAMSIVLAVLFAMFCELHLSWHYQLNEPELYTLNTMPLTYLFDIGVTVLLFVGHFFLTELMYSEQRTEEDDFRVGDKLLLIARVVVATTVLIHKDVHLMMHYEYQVFTPLLFRSIWVCGLIIVCELVFKKWFVRHERIKRAVLRVLEVLSVLLLGLGLYFAYISTDHGESLTNSELFGKGTMIGWLLGMRDDFYREAFRRWSVAQQEGLSWFQRLR